jgi:uncharacterized sulfatase
VAQNEGALQAALKDSSPYVRIVAAQALGLHGQDSSRSAALGVLRELAPPQQNGVLVSMSALAAIDALGEKAVSLQEFVRKLNSKGPSPDARYDNCVPLLIQSIAPSEARAAAPSRKAKDKAAKQSP